MAHLTLVTSSILQSPAQLYLLPVSTDGSLLDPVLNRCKTLYPDNYQQYRQACIDGLLPVGSGLLTQRRTTHTGLGVNSNHSQPTYIANLAITTHATHPTRKRWLNQALDDIYPQLYRLIRYHGLRRIALLAKPLLARKPNIPKGSLILDSAKTRALVSASPSPDKTTGATSLSFDQISMPSDIDIDAATAQTLTPANISANLKVPILQWHEDIYPLLVSKLEPLPKVRIDIHLPKELPL